MMTTPGRTQYELENETFEILWQDHGPTKKLTVFREGKKIGSKEFSHLTDQGQGVIAYAIKALLLESGLSQSS